MLTRNRAFDSGRIVEYRRGCYGRGTPLAGCLCNGGALSILPSNTTRLSMAEVLLWQGASVMVELHCECFNNGLLVSALDGDMN